MLVCGDFIYTLEIITRTLRFFFYAKWLYACMLLLFACSLEFRRTLKIIAKMLREVVNRVKLGHHHTRRRSRGEVQSRVVVRRGRRPVLY